jgi:hypothetical protein
MLLWAELDENNVVLRIAVGNDDYDSDYAFFTEHFPGRWMEVSKYTCNRTYKYDEEKDVFIPPKPEPFVDANGDNIDFVLNETDYTWDAVVV